MSMDIVAEILTKPSFVSTHIQSAAFFARQSYALEQINPNDFTSIHFVEHRAYVTGAILASVAFLEAAINEIYIEVAKEFAFQHLISEEASAALRQAWNGTAWSDSIDKRKKILEKYELFVELAQNSRFDKGNEPYQDVQHLIRLRNDLVHFKPGWRAVRPPAPMTDQERFLSSRFKANPFAHPQAHFLYDRCLGHGCAEWAVTRSIRFYDAFIALSGMLDYPLNGIRPLLTTR